MEYYRIAYVVRAHGVQGGVKLMPLTDHTSRFKGMKEAYLEREGEYTPVSLFHIGVSPDSVTLQIEGVSTRDEAEALRGAYICVDRAHAVKLPEGRYFVKDLIGCVVFDTEGEEYGVLTDVLETGANDVYVVEGKRSMLMPALKKLLRDVDTDHKRMVVDAEVLMEVAVFED